MVSNDIDLTDKRVFRGSEMILEYSSIIPDDIMKKLKNSSINIRNSYLATDLNNIYNFTLDEIDDLMMGSGSHFTVYDEMISLPEIIVNYDGTVHHINDYNSRSNNSITTHLNEFVNRMVMNYEYGTVVLNLDTVSKLWRINQYINVKKQIVKSDSITDLLNKSDYSYRKNNIIIRMKDYPLIDDNIELDGRRDVLTDKLYSFSSLFKFKDSKPVINYDDVQTLSSSTVARIRNNNMNGERNPINTWNLPEDFYDESIEMPKDEHFLQENQRDFQLGIN